MSKMNYSSCIHNSRYSSTKTIKKLKQHSHSHGSHPTFHVHSAYYNVVFINNKISTDTINNLLIHVDKCKQYSIDTESERDNNRLSLIQINSIPSKPKSFVMLFELNHLPTRNSRKYEKICQLFRSIFRTSNEIYS